MCFVIAVFVRAAAPERCVTVRNRTHPELVRQPHRFPPEARCSDTVRAFARRVGHTARRKAWRLGRELRARGAAAGAVRRSPAKEPMAWTVLCASAGVT